MLDVLLLRLLHCIVALSSILGQWIQRFPKNLKFMYGKETVIRTIQSDARTLKKLPLHIGIVILEENFSYTDIANMIVWSVALGISYISLYDTNGQFKQNSSLLNEEVVKRKKEMLQDDCYKYDIQIHSTGSVRHEPKGFSGSGTEVYLLSVEDGRQSLVQRTRELCQMVSSNQHRIADITPNTVDKLLQDFHKFPDPDIILKYGPVESLLGYMPWHIRLTEILSFPSHKGIDYSSFFKSLQIYGHTQQRFGK